MGSLDLVRDGNQDLGAAHEKVLTASSWGRVGCSAIHNAGRAGCIADPVGFDGGRLQGQRQPRRQPLAAASDCTLEGRPLLLHADEYTAHLKQPGLLGHL